MKKVEANFEPNTLLPFGLSQKFYAIYVIQSECLLSFVLTLFRFRLISCRIGLSFPEQNTFKYMLF